METGILILALFFLFCASVLSGFHTSLHRLGRIGTAEELKKRRKVFFFQNIFHFFFGQKKWEGLLFTISFTKHIMQLGYAGIAIFFLLTHNPWITPSELSSSAHAFWILALVAITISLSILIDFTMSLIATASPTKFFRIFAPLTSLLLTLFAPISFLFLKLLRLILAKIQISPFPSSSFRMRDKILELLYDSDITSAFDAHDQKLILSVASFKERIAREVMVPRIDIYSLPASTPIKEAGKQFYEEGYSRIPVYKETVDQVIGVLLYKDVLNVYAQAIEDPTHTPDLNNPIEKYIKPVIYTPQTKKISNLLQEFRNKQIHMAIVVDEYGGTEGIVTIEDILEELVGEIADEHDFGEELPFTVLPSGDWILDAKMSIIDIEKELLIRIPPSPEYETIGGYIFHKAGSIPSKGWRIHHDDFDLEVLSSDDRTIHKVRITVLKSS